MRTPLKSLLLVAAASLALLFASPSMGQELSTFLTDLPPEGAWARYRVETVKPDQVKKEPFDLAITGKETVGGQSFVWLEAGPTNFAGYRDGYLRILIKGKPSPDEARNPFLSAVALAYQEPGGDPFELSDGAMGFLHNQASDVKITQTEEDLPPGAAASIKGETFACTRRRITTTTETSFMTRKIKVVETGDYWFSPKTPFRIVKAEIDRVEYRGDKEKRKHITLTLKEASETGAQTHFTKPVKEKKGLLGILFH
jgi:hypothetical protein